MLYLDIPQLTDFEEVDMNVVMVVLRILHVAGGVYWAGATFVLASHVSPSAKATGEAGQAFMRHLSGKAKLSDALGVTGTITLLSGLIMYGLQGWDKQLGSANGIALTLGVVLGAAAYFHGLFVQRKAITNLARTGAEIAAAGAPPSPEQIETIAGYQAKIERNGQILAYILAVTVVLMGVFQYL